MILSYFNQTLAAHGTPSVTIVGHSLSAAIALFDGIYFRGYLYPSVNVRVIGYGMPRAGNQEVANWVDKHLVSGQVTHINASTTRRTPSQFYLACFLRFHHPAGEIYLTVVGIWESCPGERCLSLSPA